MKKKKQNKKWLFLIIGFVILAITIIVLLKLFHVPTKTYHSNFLKISFEYPTNYKIDEKLTNIILANSKGEIIISRTGTNFEKISDYVDNLSILNKFTINNKNEISINGNESISGEINNERYYFIYTNDWTIFSISTKIPDLYPDLDRIAQSFRYEP